MQLWELCLASKNLYCKLGFVKLQIRVLNYNVTGCARLIGIHLGDHRVDDEWGIHPYETGLSNKHGHTITWITLL